MFNVNQLESCFQGSNGIDMTFELQMLYVGYMQGQFSRTFSAVTSYFTATRESQAAEEFLLLAKVLA